MSEEAGVGVSGLLRSGSVSRERREKGLSEVGVVMTGHESCTRLGGNLEITCLAREGWALFEFFSFFFFGLTR